LRSPLSLFSFSSIVGKANCPGRGGSSSSEGGGVHAGWNDSGSQVRSTAISLRDIVPIELVSRWHNNAVPDKKD
jgi:hypothetical protein